jgi:hypothetical protein
VVGLVGAWTYFTVSSEVHRGVKATLEGMLVPNATALRLWLEHQTRVASLIAADPRVREDVVEILAVSRRAGGDAETLRKAPVQTRLREVLSPIVSLQQNAGYFVLDPGGLILARTVDERVGGRVSANIAETAARALAGKPAFLAPTLKQRFTPEPMAFVMVPVRDKGGTAVAVFSFRIDSDQMAAIVNASRPGLSGETYAVNADGLMVSPSRFEAEVGALGLLPPEANGSTVAALEVRDPGFPLKPGPAPATPPKSWPLTRAVADVVRGAAGSSVEGYRDYRGVPVVGAWTWLPDWGIGVVSEIDRTEAFASLRVVRRAFGALALALLVGALGLGLSSRKIRGLEKDVERAQRLGQYTLEEKIGQGGMGAVYKARHALLRRPTAIKLIRSDKAGAPMLARFEREVQLTSQLTHPNTISIYDYGRTPEGVFYYAMEYLPGLPLDRVVEDGAQPEARVVHLLRQISGSLAEAHRVGLVHRDIKPGNLVLCERGGVHDFVKVLDFGLVKELGEEDSDVTAADHLVGTPLYLAPEGARSASLVDARSDVYALGAVAYVLLTAQQVFAGRTAAEIIGHHIHSKPVPPSERLGRPVHPDLERIILACLAKDPAERPLDASVLLLELEGLSGPVWTEREAREWWDGRGTRLLAVQAAKIATLSRGPKLAVDVESRVASRSLEELEIEGTATKVRVRPPDRPGP